MGGDYDHYINKEQEEGEGGGGGGGGEGENESVLLLNPSCPKKVKSFGKCLSMYSGCVPLLSWIHCQEPLTGILLKCLELTRAVF